MEQEHETKRIKVYVIVSFVGNARELMTKLKAIKDITNVEFIYEIFASNNFIMVTAEVLPGHQERLIKAIDREPNVGDSKAFIAS